MPGQARKMKLKICLVGEPAVGKTSLINRYLYNTFDQVYRTTLGSKLHLMSFSKYVTTDDVVEAQVALFDLMGQHAAQDAFRDSMFWGAHGFMAVADVTRPQTLQELPQWVHSVRATAGEIPFVILLNKSDLVGRTAIGPRETAWLKETFADAPSAFTSAKSGEGVEYAFETLLDRVVGARLARERARQAMDRLGTTVLERAQKRGKIGVTTTELLVSMKGTDIKTLMAVVGNLEQLGYAVSEEIAPGRFRVLLTPPGEQALRDGLGEIESDEDF